MPRQWSQIATSPGRSAAASAVAGSAEADQRRLELAGLRQRDPDLPVARRRGALVTDRQVFLAVAFELFDAAEDVWHEWGACEAYGALPSPSRKTLEISRQFCNFVVNRLLQATPLIGARYCGSASMRDPARERGRPERLAAARRRCAGRARDRTRRLRCAGTPGRRRTGRSRCGRARSASRRCAAACPASRRCSSSSLERELADRGDGGGGDAAAAALARHPVAEVRALERAAHDVRDRDLAGELAALEDQEAVGGAGVAVALDGGQPRALAGAREEAGLAARIPGREVLALGGEERCDARRRPRAPPDGWSPPSLTHRQRSLGSRLTGRVRSRPCLWHGAPRSSRSARRSPSSPSSCSSASSPAASASSPRPCTPASTRRPRC